MSSYDKAFRDYGIEEYVPMEGRHYGNFYTALVDLFYRGGATDADCR
jgi:hypothetical protein